MPSPAPALSVERILTPDGQDQIVHLPDPSRVREALRILGTRTPRPVVVLIGGAEQMSPEDAHRIRESLDRAVLPVAAAQGAVIVTGGTQAGVMQLLGEFAACRPGAELIGVAPAAQVRHALQPAQENEKRAALDPNHHKFILTAGESWGSETDVLLAVATELASGSAQGVVVLANGGKIAQHEASRFLAAGWAILTLKGSGRSADALAQALARRRGRRSRWNAVVGHTPRYRDGWGSLSSADVEVHDLAKDSVPLLYRRLNWRLSDQLVLRAAWSRYASYDAAAGREQRSTRRFQGGLAIGAFVLTITSVVYGSLYEEGALKGVLVLLPLILAVASTLTDVLVPSRNWLALRQAAEAIQRAIYRSRAGLHRSGEDAAGTLVLELSEVDQRVLRAGVPLGVLADMTGRPAVLSPESDEFAPLSARVYMTERVGGQLTYYRRTAQKLRQRELVAVGTSAALAAAATAAASEADVALWVPVLVLAASTIVILQQRARWQDKVNLCGTAIADLETVRTTFLRATEANAALLVRSVLSTEDVLEREQLHWGRTVAESQQEAGRYRQPHVDTRV